MKIRFLTVCGILLALTVFGCKPSEESKTAGTAPDKSGQKMEQTTKSVVEETKEAVTTAAEKTEEMAQKAAEETKEAVATAVDKTEQVARNVTEESGKMMAAASKALSTDVSPPETLVFEASYGNITFPHGMHAKSYDCATCHGEGTPGAFGLNKDKAHELCKGCHKKEGAGPSNCKDCHKK